MTQFSCYSVTSVNGILANMKHCMHLHCWHNQLYFIDLAALALCGQANALTYLSFMYIWHIWYVLQ